MLTHQAEGRAPAAEQSEEGQLVARAAARDEAAIRAIMQRYNRRLYRLARAVLRDDAEAEDAVQQAYVKAFSGIAGFRGEAGLSTWLSRIVINVALDGARQRRRASQLAIAAQQESSQTHAPHHGAPPLDPERSLAQREIRTLLERAIDALPDAFRTVLMARVVEGLSVEETSELLGLRPETVKTRLHRARRLVREALEAELGPMVTAVFPFAGKRCEQLADAVIAKLNNTG
jgi:RNA polymerase sigma-70 factor (ECF subfamily)